VVVTFVDHLNPTNPPRRLIGRSGTVWGHENGMNIVTGLTILGSLRGQAFADDRLTPTSHPTRGHA